MEYMEARTRYTEAKAEQRRLHEEVIRIKERNKPMLDFKKYGSFLSGAFFSADIACRKLDNDMKRVNQKRDDKKKAAQNKFKLINTKKDENDDWVRTPTPDFRLTYRHSLPSRENARKTFRTSSRA